MLKTRINIANVFLAIIVVPILAGFFMNDPLIVTWIFNVIFLFYCLKNKSRVERNSPRGLYRIANIYLIWAFICVIRGLYEAQGYWDYKALVAGTFNISFPLLLFPFSEPKLVSKTLYLWLRWCIPFFFIAPVFYINAGNLQFYMAPLFLIGCYMDFSNKFWRLTILFFLIFMLVGEVGARAQVMKSAFTIFLYFIIKFRNKISEKILYYVMLLMLFMPIIFLSLALTGCYNVLKEGLADNKNHEEYSKQDAAIYGDSRTFLYEEVIASSINNNYVWQGRTPMRGNDSEFFLAKKNAEITGRSERFMNEVCHPNIYTWLGLLGLIPWCMIYIYGALISFKKSNNIYSKYISLMIAFHFFMGWIEDMNQFTVFGFYVWIIIAMGYSAKFRTMRNEEYETWIKSIFIKNNK